MQTVKSNDDIDMLKCYFDWNFKNETMSDITPFSNIDMVFKWTNEEFELYPKENLQNKSVLTITSSGDHALDAILNGATDIDSIDINIFCKYYSALKIAMIKKYEYYEFFEKINTFTSNDPGSAEFATLEEISKYLSDIEIEFWNTYIQLKQQKWCMFWSKSNHGPGRNRYYSEGKYAELKYKLNDVTINYYDGDVIGIKDILGNKTYDFIYLSNILERIDTQKKLKDRSKVLQELLKIMNEKGCIYNYMLNLDAIATSNAKIIEKFLGNYYESLKNDFKFDYIEAINGDKLYKPYIISMQKK